MGLGYDDSARNLLNNDRSQFVEGVLRNSCSTRRCRVASYNPARLARGNIVDRANVVLFHWGKPLHPQFMKTFHDLRGVLRPAPEPLGASASRRLS